MLVFLSVHETSNGKTLNNVIRLRAVKLVSLVFHNFHANGKRQILTRINEEISQRTLVCACIVRVVRWELILECCITKRVQNTYPAMRRATLQTHLSTAIIRPCWTRRNHFFGQDNIMPCLKPTKGGRIILKNDAQRELRHTSTTCTDSWKTLIFY